MRGLGLWGTIVLVAACGTMVVSSSQTRLSEQTDVHQLRPADEAAQEPQLVTLRQQLISYARSRNDPAIRAVMTPALRARVPAPLDFRELEEALELGGTYTTIRGAVRGRREFCAPYVYSAFPKFSTLRSDLAREGDNWVIVAENVPVRGRPSAQAPVEGRLSFEIVRLTDAEILKDENGRPVWAIVRRPGRGPGYVPATAVRATFDYAVCFAKIADQWAMTFFDRHFPTD